MTRVVYPANTKLPVPPVEMAAAPTAPKWQPTVTVEPPTIIATPQYREKSEYKLEDNIPAPPRRVGISKYPFPDMKPGQSFFVPDGKLKTITASSQSYRNSEKQKGNIVSFASRDWINHEKDADGNEIEIPGVRCWRTK